MSFAVIGIGFFELVLAVEPVVFGQVQAAVLSVVVLVEVAVVVLLRVRAVLPWLYLNLIQKYTSQNGLVYKDYSCFFAVTPCTHNSFDICVSGTGHSPICFWYSFTIFHPFRS